MLPTSTALSTCARRARSSLTTPNSRGDAKRGAGRPLAGRALTALDAEGTERHRFRCDGARRPRRLRSDPDHWRRDRDRAPKWDLGQGRELPGGRPVVPGSSGLLLPRGSSNRWAVNASRPRPPRAVQGGTGAPVGSPTRRQTTVARYSGREHVRTGSAQEPRPRRSRRWRIASRAVAAGRARTATGPARHRPKARRPRPPARPPKAPEARGRRDRLTVPLSWACATTALRSARRTPGARARRGWRHRPSRRAP